MSEGLTGETNDLNNPENTIDTGEDSGVKTTYTSPKPVLTPQGMSSMQGVPTKENQSGKTEDSNTESKQENTPNQSNNSEQ